jgi:hypothetical protein
VETRLGFLRLEAHQSSIIVSTRACRCMLLTIQLLTPEAGESLAKFAARCGLKVPRKVDNHTSVSGTSAKAFETISR